MAVPAAASQPGDVPRAPPRDETAVLLPDVEPRPPVDLSARRSRVDLAVRATAQAPVRHLPAALLDALQGSWGMAQELLDLPVVEPAAGSAR